MTTKQEIRSWLEEGKKKNATHMIVVVDTFDYDDYPVFVSPEESARAVYDSYDGKNMQRVMEVYDLSKDIEMQLSERRAFHID